MASCDRCKRTYEDIYEGCTGNQGWGCAASAVKRDGNIYVSAGYGSKFDLCLIKVVGEEGVGVSVGMEICDACIEKFIKEGVAIHDHAFCDRVLEERWRAGEHSPTEEIDPFTAACGGITNVTPIVCPTCGKDGVWRDCRFCWCCGAPNVWFDEGEFPESPEARADCKAGHPCIKEDAADDPEVRRMYAERPFCLDCGKRIFE
ncbi:MAG: hypothetical protein Q7S84_03655 [bacterium]|nr:hypothetical protein [bacterium]